MVEDKDNLEKTYVASGVACDPEKVTFKSKEGINMDVDHQLMKSTSIIQDTVLGLAHFNKVDDEEDLDNLLDKILEKDEDPLCISCKKPLSDPERNDGKIEFTCCDICGEKVHMTCKQTVTTPRVNTHTNENIDYDMCIKCFDRHTE
ncbi:hypothetical protein LCGC14_0175570 [marine sediment metagenome]|uniref:Uncharacterized protein n=1 Tax=marine sediment metagenome TaxID=412755 RepID=A0A0F9XTS5_9ZZZZ